MKGPFGMLLVGGGIILLIGLFTGKITFPGAGAAAPSLTPAQQQQVAKSTGGTAPVGGKCPPGNTLMGGVCIPNSVLGQI